MPGYGQTPPGFGTLPWGPDQVAQPAVQPGRGNSLPSWIGYSGAEILLDPLSQALRGVPTYTRVHPAPLWSAFNTSGAALSLTISPTTIGDLVVAAVINQGGTSVASLSGGGVTTWTRVGTPWTDPEATPSVMEIWWGVVTATGSSSISVTWNAAVGAHYNEITVQDFHSSLNGIGTWAAESPGGTISNKTNASSATVTYPAVTTTQPAEVYVGYASTPSAISTSAPSPAGFVAGLTGNNNCEIIGTEYQGGGVQPTHGVSLSEASWAVGACFYMQIPAPAATWQLVQQSAAPSTITSAGAVTPTLPAPSTAGNLVLLKVLTGGSIAAPTGVTAGFTARANNQQATAPASRCDIYDYINNPGGISSATATLGNGGSGFLEEWTLSTGTPGPGVVADATGNAKNVAPVTPFTVATSGATTAAHEMAAVAYVQRFSATTSCTLAAGAGFTQAGAANNGVTAITHFGFDYQADTGASGVTPSDATTTTSTGAGSQNGLIVTYAISATAAITQADVAGAAESLAVSVSVPVADAAGAADAVKTPMESLTDNFPGSSVDATKWTAFGTATVASNTLTLTDTANSTAYSGIQSLKTYDLTGSYLLAHLTNGGSQFASTQAFIQVSLDANNSLALILNNGNLLAQTDVAGSFVTRGSIAWVGATMSWLRIRESGGTIFWDYSADGSTWTNLTSLANPFAVTSMTAWVEEGAYTTSDPAATSTWQSVNLPTMATAVSLADAGAAVEAASSPATVPLADVAGGADVVAVPAETIPLAEVAGAADVVAVPTRTLPLAEVAGAAEQLAVSATVPAGEVAVGAEALSLAVAVPLAEVGASAETVALAATVPLAEVAGAAEYTPRELWDPAGASDLVATTATVPVAETGAAAESLTVAATLAVADAAGAADVASVSTTVPLAEVGAGTEASAATATLPLADVAGSSEALLSGQPTSLAEAAAGTEAQVVSVTSAAADVAGGYESLSVAAAASVADAAGAVEQVAPGAAVPVADAGAGAEAQLIGVAPADAAAAAEALSVSATVPAADIAGATDAVSVVQGSQVAFTESAGALEQPSVSVASPAGEAAGAVESLAAQAALVFADQAGAADAIAVVAGATPQLPDAGAAADATGVAASAPVTDASGAVESAAASATVPLPERAGAVEAQGVSATLPLLDAGSAADSLATAQAASPVLGDAAGGTEALSAAVTTAGHDVVAAAESLMVFQSRSLADSAAAAESLIYVIPPTGPQPVWEAGPAALRWQVLATAPAWQVATTRARWEAVATPPRWDVSAAPVRWRVIMAVFEPIASVSVENVNATWTSDLGGTEVDPTTGPMPVRFAFPVSSGDELNPAQPVTWFTGTWLTPVAGRYKGFIAQVIVGPTSLGGLVQLTRGGKYDVWSEVDTGTETVRKFVGVQAVY
jgi:hypothetical protein